MTVTFVLLVGGTAAAQLLSPGDLSAAHADLEGVAKCTSCHTIGGKGVDEAKCLDCHRPIRSRIEAGKGLHGNLTEPCTACHKDHLGRNFRLARVDTTAFDHISTGYELLGAHTRVACSSCHRSDLITAEDVKDEIDQSESPRKTFLGLETSCASCHASDNPHRDQFEGRACTDCHTPSTWAPAEAFRHDASRFQLTGRHVDVRCENCHRPSSAGDGLAHAQFMGLNFNECSSCHADPHGSAFGPVCTSCHNTAGWSSLNSERSFSHRQTGYPLLGAHARLSCSDCHRRPARRDAMIHVSFVDRNASKAFPRIEAASCRSCHVDFHRGQFREELSSVACDECHSQDGWTPTAFGVDRHDEQSRFALSGAHVSVPCLSCHVKAGAQWRFQFEDRRCQSCHASDNPHGTQFDARMETSSCASCHGTAAWNSDVDFDHKSTGFELTGAHTYLKCTRCHRQESQISPSYGINYAGLHADCASCHADRDPHHGQFEGQDCGACHEPTSFKPVSSRFDHQKTRFPLDGAHGRLACASCHATEIAPDGSRFARFLLNKTQCVDCHTSE